MIRIGTAGWTIPPAHAALFPREGSHLARYAARFDAVEINSSFHRSHRPATYARWAATVPSAFRFAVKLPRAITHDAMLLGAQALVGAFAAEVAHLGDRLGPVLMQLPPKLAFDAAVAGRFLDALQAALPTQIVCEPRHPSWFEPAADALLADRGVTRVASDPARVPLAAKPGGSTALAYFRLHGSPQVYTSLYGAERLTVWRDAMQAAPAQEVWCIFDNTARGAAALDATMLASMMLPSTLQRP